MVMVYRRVLATCALGEEEEPFLVVDDQVVRRLAFSLSPFSRSGRSSWNGTAR